MKHTTPKAIRPLHVAPPLPADIAQLLRSELRSRNASRKRLAIEACLAARAFAAGLPAAPIRSVRTGGTSSVRIMSTGSAATTPDSARPSKPQRAQTLPRRFQEPGARVHPARRAHASRHNARIHPLTCNYANG
jgi:hypothetical protein